jgi:hypothetical protein
MDARQERRAKNESLFRDVNERIQEFELEVGTAELSAFICECDDLTCAERFEMSAAEYERLRADATTFAVVPGHESPDVEDVVAEAAGYYVVRKHAGDPARLAIEDAPR